MVNKAQSLNDEKSIYLQIAERIENDILRGIILEEEKVLSTNEFARMLAINPATAAKGINILVDQGILYKKRGIGMFVATGAKEMILNRRRGEFLESYVSNLLKEAERLGISKEEIIALIQKSDEI
ncbi:MAG: GntR family transcriptional regulator [Treponemataceae bacterium]|nr:GntR family transcriptional regulator [Treponemataceae bacterium]